MTTASSDIPTDVWVSKHLLDRLREDHPLAGWRGALRLLDQSDPVERGEVAGFLHRSLDACSDWYFIVPDRRGILVLTAGKPEHARAWTLVTYIRLSPSQRAEAERLWGPARR